MTRVASLAARVLHARSRPAHAQARRRGIGMLAAAILFGSVLPATAQDPPSIVTLTAGPSPFTSGATITLDATVDSGGGPGCLNASTCLLMGTYTYVHLYGPNNYYRYFSNGDTSLQAQDTDSYPGQVLQAATYTATGGVVWALCMEWNTVECLEEDLHWEPVGSDQATVTPTAMPTMDGVSPSSGTAGTQLFTAQYSSAAGYADVMEAWLLIHSAPSGPNSCLVTYAQQTGLLGLLNDAGTTRITAPIGSGTILENSQCRVLTGGASASGNSTTLTVAVPVAFKAGYAGVKNLFMQGGSVGGLYSDWQDRGDWVVPAHSLTTGVSPSNGGGSTQTFTLGYTSNYGAGDLQQGQLWFSPTIAPTGAQSCQVAYTPSSHTLSLLNDAGTGWSQAGVGTQANLQNSQCAVNAQTAGASSSGNTWTVNVPITFSSTFDGVKNIYMAALTYAGPATGWQDRGDWDPLCTFDVSPPSSTVGSSAGSLNISVTTTSVCPWTAPSSSAFLTLSGGGSMSGSGSVTYAFGSHTGDPRSTQVTVAGTPVSVMQSGTIPAAGEVVVYYHTDALGSVRVLTDANGQIYPNQQTHYDYLPHGVLWLEPLHKDRRLFTGHERDQESSLDYFGARHYAPATGRFTSPDPIVLTSDRVMRPDLINRYSYANNNPLSFIDPNGLQSCQYLNVECPPQDLLDTVHDIGMFFWRLQAWWSQMRFAPAVQAAPDGDGQAQKPPAKRLPKLELPNKCEAVLRDRVGRLSVHLDRLAKGYLETRGGGPLELASFHCFDDGSSEIRIHDEAHPCLRECALKHEQRHAEQCRLTNQQRGGKGGTVIDYANNILLYERAAYRVELVCTLQKLQ